MTTETQSFHNFSQEKSQKLGHWAVIEIFQKPTSSNTKLWTFLVFIVGIFFLHPLLVVPMTLMVYFGAKFWRIRRILKGFDIPLYGDFKTMILKTVIIPELKQDEVELFIKIIDTKLKITPHLKNYNFLTLTSTRGMEFLKAMISFDELQTVINIRLKIDNKQ